MDPDRVDRGLETGLWIRIELTGVQRQGCGSE